MAYTYRIWDGVSPINGCDAETAKQALHISDSDQVYILAQDGRDCMVQTHRNTPYPRETIEQSAQAHIDAMERQKENELSLQQEITDLQLALAEVFELLQ